MTNISTLDYVENFTISKSLNDRMWKLVFPLDKDEAPAPMTGIRAFATDHNDVEHCLFVGFIPGADYIRQSVNNKVSITAYDFTWYLTAQKVHRDYWELQIVDGGWSEGDFISRLLGDANSLNVTGLKLHPVYGYEDDRWYYWGPQTTKIEAIEEMAEYEGQIIFTMFEQEGSAYVPTFYVNYYNSLELYLPAQVTFTSPSVYVISQSIKTDEMEDYNRVTVYGQERFTGNPYEAIEETAEVAACEEKPIEYVFVDANLDSQALVNAKALSLFNTLNGISSATYTAVLRKRYDLRLLQLVKFVGYSDIPEVDMRIISITYQRALNDDIVAITFTTDQSFDNLKLLARYISDDSIQTQQQVINDALNELTHIGIGEVTAVDSNIATVDMERSGNTIKARILT